MGNLEKHLKNVRALKTLFTTLQYAVILLACAIFAISCSTDDGPTKGNNNSGAPYQFRVEFTLEDPDKFFVAFDFANYNYVDENRLPRTIWFAEELSGQENAVASPLTKDFEVPRNFSKAAIVAGVYFIRPFVPSDKIPEREQETISGKLFINDNFIAETSAKFGCSFGVGYDSSKKKYIVTMSGGKTIELDKLD